MKLPILDHAELYVTADFLSRRPPDPVRVAHPLFSGSGAEPGLERLQQRLDEIMTAFADPLQSEGAAARAIHESLPLTRREAADMRFWHYLALVKLPHYVCWRYFDTRAGRTNRSRYTGLLDDNALARLWWFADLTLDPAHHNRYWRTERTATSLEFIKGIVENLFGGNRWLVSSLADHLFSGNGKVLDAFVEKVFTHANVLLVSIAVDALNREEVDRFATHVILDAGDR